jgi:hypothetical protein
MERSRILSCTDYPPTKLAAENLSIVHLCTPSFYISEDDPEGEEILRGEWEERDREMMLGKFSNY